MAVYGPAVPNSRANPLGMVSQPPSKVSGLLYCLGLGASLTALCFTKSFVAPHGHRRKPLPVNTIAGLEVNTLADGFFHLATWVLVLAASIAAITAWRQGRLAPNWSFHFGLVLTGGASSTSWRGQSTIRYLASVTYATTLMGPFLGTSDF